MLEQDWGNEPSIVRLDIRGFLTTRCMYTLMCEAFCSVERILTKATKCKKALDTLH